MASESKRTVLVALGANLAIALAKAAAGLVSGSSSMLAEAAHSFADTLNQVFLLTSLKVSARPADSEHPFGYGKAQYFWSLLAAVGIFVAGSVFSVYEGVHTLRHGSESGGVLVPFVVLGVSFLAEGTSWLRAVGQLRGEARVEQRTFRQHIRARRTRRSRPSSRRTVQPWSASPSRRPGWGCTTSPATPPGTAGPPSRSACCSRTWPSSWAGTTPTS